MTGSTRLRIPQGILRCAVDEDVVSAKGVPYAAAPFGSLRFQPPAAPPGWAGERDARRYGPTVPKAPYRHPVAALLIEPAIPGEECLNLNVWTPDPTASLPVLVWLHGGAFVSGSGAVPTYDGSAFARDGVVCVTVNYRLNIDGFACLDGAVGNRGTLDQLAALRWVRDTIHCFGGDAAQVTLAGESAGAMSTATLLSLPATRGLFRRAIMQSGGGNFVLTRRTARKVNDELAALLGTAPTAAAFAAVPIPDLLAAQVELRRRIAQEPAPEKWFEIARNGMPWEPYLDGAVIADLPIDQIAAGWGSDVDVLTGTTSEEENFHLVPSGQIDEFGDADVSAELAAFGAGPGAESVYRVNHPDASPGELVAMIRRDWFFWIPAVRIAEARARHGRATYVYEFAWRSPKYAGQLGACHAVEVPFVFDTLTAEGSDWLTGADPPQGLATETHRAWVRFVAAGEPGWPAYGDRRTVRRFDTPSTTQHDPRPDERMVWAGIR